MEVTNKMKRLSGCTVREHALRLHAGLAAVSAPRELKNIPEYQRNPSINDRIYMYTGFLRSYLPKDAITS